MAGSSNTPKNLIQRVRGVQTSVPSAGYVLGRASNGSGSPELIPLQRLVSQAISLAGGSLGNVQSALPPIADGDILANKSGGAAVPVAQTISDMLDYVFGSTQGHILTRGASAWTVLAEGANNTVLTGKGAGANIAYQTLSALLDAVLGSTQGSVIYRNASTWTVLGPGTSGQALLSGGAAANPSWGAAALAAIADGDVLGNKSGGSAAPGAQTLTAMMDYVFGSTQGDILYRNASTWTVLAPGTSGQALTSGGAAANPSWATPAVYSWKIQVFTSSGTYTPTAGMVNAIIECIPGGAGSGAANGAVGLSNGGGGGGGGGYARALVTAAQVGASKPVTVGAGGAAGTTAPANGGNGGTSSVGTLCSAAGGNGGVTGTPAAFGFGGLGGAGTIGDVLGYGSSGQNGSYSTNTSVAASGGDGGGTLFGTGGIGGMVTAGASVAQQAAPGGFGAGAAGSAINNVAGGAVGSPGTSGFVIITELVKT